MEDAPVLSPPTGKERIHCKYNSPNTIMCTPDKHPQVLFLPPAIRSKRVHQNVRIGAVGVIGAVIAANVFDALLAMAVTFSVEVDVALTGAVIAGFAAQMVDGALGMGFGMTSTTVMVSVAGLSPLAASTSVHLAQLGTTALSGLSHYSCGNVNMQSLARLAPAGMVGAFIGATVLASIPTSSATLVSAGLMVGLGAYVLLRSAICGLASSAVKGDTCAPGWPLLLPLGLWGGFVDATGGGGWGPVTTTGLLADNRLPPAKVVGTVSAAEFLVTVAAVLGFVHHLGLNLTAPGMRVDLVGGLLVGGLLAAPVAPLLIQRLQADTLGVTIGSFICLTNARTLLKVAHASWAVCCAAYSIIGLAWLTALAWRARSCPPDSSERTRSSRTTTSPSSPRRGLHSLRAALDPKPVLQ